MRKQTVCGCRSWRWESSFFFFFFLPNYLVGNPTRFLGSPTRLWRLAIIYDWQLFQFHPVFKLCNDSVDFSTSPFFWHCYYYHFSFSFIWSFSTNRSVNNSIVAIHFPPKENVGLVCLPFFYFISQFKISLSLPIWLPSMSTTSVGGAQQLARGAVMLLVVSGHAHRLNRHMSKMILSRVQVPSTSRPTKSQRGPVIIQMTLGRRDKGSN